MRIWSSIFGRKDGAAAHDDPEAFSRRMDNLEARLSRLDREVEVIQRVRTDEEPAE